MEVRNIRSQRLPGVTGRTHLTSDPYLSVNVSGGQTESGEDGVHLPHCHFCAAVKLTRCCAFADATSWERARSEASDRYGRASHGPEDIRVFPRPAWQFPSLRRRDERAPAVGDDLGR